VMLNHSVSKFDTPFKANSAAGFPLGDSEHVTTLRMQYNF